MPKGPSSTTHLISAFAFSEPSGQRLSPTAGSEYSGMMLMLSPLTLFMAMMVMAMAAGDLDSHGAADDGRSQQLGIHEPRLLYHRFPL